MSVLVQHANLAIRMYNNGIDRDFIKQFSLNDIISCCDRLEENEMLSDGYKDNKVIQEELLRDEKFIKYLNIAYKKEYNMSAFQDLLENIKSHGEKMSDYSIKCIFGTLDNKKLCHAAYYDFLTYCIDENLSTRKTFTDNLNYFYTQINTKFEELTENERELMKYHSLDSYNLIPHNNIKQIYKFLTDNVELIKLIDFFNARKLYICLDKEAYEIINNNTKEIRVYIETITNKIKNDDITYQMLSKWVGNGCKLYDLKKIDEKIANIKSEKLETAFNNRSSYVNFIYGSKLKNFPLNEIYGAREELIIYAISNNKKNFLKLIEENMEEFLAIPSNSIIYRKNLYTTYININELTVKHLVSLKSMIYSSKYSIDILNKNIYTFEEINALYAQDWQYIALYNELLDLKIDDRLVRIRQLLDDISGAPNINQLAKMIKIKPLYLWIENDFNKIADITINDVIQMLINYETIDKFIPEIANRNEVRFILRNLDRIQDYDNLKDMKNDIENIDSYWLKMKDELNFSNEFTEKYKENIIEFLLNNGSELAYTYYLNCTEEHRNSFKLIIKAQLMGEFKKLKYHTNDLEKELDYELNEEQINEWTSNNSKIINGKYKVCEYDDFYHTMILGEYPTRTCLSYISGGYNKCLLACFDSNKKILYAKVDEKIVARAMIRLTKGTFNKKRIKGKMLNFIDVENEKQNNTEEHLTLFLERIYTSGITNEEVKTIKKLFINLLKEKAKLMNALLVLSSEYRNAVDEQFEEKEYCMYISKSKASAQYLDSLSGQATVESEGQYKSNWFLIGKQIEDEDAIFEESIFKVA